VAPSALAVFEVERLEPGVVVLGFHVEETAEGALLVELARGDGELLPAASLAHHVSQAGLLHRAHKLGALLEGHRSGDRAEHVLASRKAKERVPDMLRRRGGQEDGLDLGVLNELLQRRVGFGTPVGLLQSSAAVRTEVAHGLDDAIGMLVELEGRAEAAPNDADADLAGLAGKGT